MSSVSTSLHAVILAAGGSRRMGSPKALLSVRGVPWICAHVRAFQSVGAAVTAVLGADFDRIRAVLPASVRVVRNPEWETTDAARSAFLGLQGCGRGFVMPVDVPPPTTPTLLAMLASGVQVVPTFSGCDGHPLLLFPPHPDVRLDERARSLARLAVYDPDCILNLNTPSAFNAWGKG